MAETGRPSEYTKEVADLICAELAIGKSLRSVISDNDDVVPSMPTIFKWLRDYPDFLKQYACAKQESADAMAEEILDIADDGQNDWMEKEVGEGGDTIRVVDHEHIQRSKLRVDTRKWLMSKHKPKKYADKLDLTSGGERLPAPILGNVLDNNIDKKDREAQEED